MSTSKEILQDIIKRSLFIRFGKRTVVIIKRRTNKGKFLPGSSEGAESYSTNPFVMPLGAVRKKSVIWDMLNGKFEDDTQLFRTKAGKMWVWIRHGYKWLRQQQGRQVANVDMTQTRQLMRSLDVLKIDTGSGVVEVGHKGKRNQELAYYWNEAGAGKSKKKRIWLGLTEGELKKLAGDV